ncbi:hypothetical protein [Jiangella mangrovi]|uniref:Uncharacterized protein n=1 Tax=Jiangella mangrovi TaxID=1524084 RepID=A0A7W9GRY4_9ACTN|nr:hypothetical protein [Jiangella mangrovi]MBB5788827.1 hypothetical protein [Jiangella mangrovi]
MTRDAGDDETPVVAATELEELAEQASNLAQAIDEASARLRAHADDSSKAGWRLDEAVGAARGAARELAAAAGDLSPEPGSSNCGITWGVCPDHGKTLTGTAGRSWCRRPGCGRSWHYDRASLPCTEPIAFEVRTPRGDSTAMCRGHAVAALELQAGITLDPVPPDVDAGPRS